MLNDYPKGVIVVIEVVQPLEEETMEMILYKNVLFIAVLP